MDRKNIEIDDVDKRKGEPNPYQFLSIAKYSRKKPLAPDLECKSIETIFSIIECYFVALEDITITLETKKRVSKEDIHDLNCVRLNLINLMSMVKSRAGNLRYGPQHRHRRQRIKKFGEEKVSSNEERVNKEM